jgi:hypothetical protein
MLRVSVELIPSWVGPPKQLGVMTITNDGTGTPESGNYYATLNGSHHAFTGFPRQELNVWDLVHRALDAVLGFWAAKKGIAP